MLRQSILLLSIAAVVGCASNPSLSSDPTGLDDRQLCYLREEATAKGNDAVRESANTELRSRGHAPAVCAHWITQDQEARQARVDKFTRGLSLALTSFAAGMAAASASSNSYATTQTYSTVYDYEWDWDVFYNEYSILTARCRGVQTGQFADNWRCNGKAQTDWRWPGK